MNTITLGLTLVFSAGILAAQQNVRARLEGRVPPEVSAAVANAAAQAASLGLPVEPLVQKALEGAAKGVPAERVITAVQELAARLATAAGALRESGVAEPGAAAIEAGAFALTTGLSPQQVRAVATVSVPPYDPATSLRVAGTLAAIGVPGKQVVEVVSASIEAGLTQAEVAALPNSIQTRMARGATPAQAAAGQTRATAARPAAPANPSTDRPTHPARTPARP